MKTTLHLLPILAVHAVLVLAYVLPGPNLRVDETRYTALAEALTHGRYTVGAGLDLWSGPGYPLILFPFAKLSLPWAAARFANAGFMFLAAVYIFRALRLYASARVAYIGAYVVGLYPPVMELAPRLMTEPAAIFLASGFMYHFCRASGRASDVPGADQGSGMGRAGRAGRAGLVHAVIAAVYLGYLALTRVIFGYVIAASLVGFIAHLAWRRRRTDLRGAIICCLAIAVSAPYLVYTHSVTGRVFYWGNSGGLSLYWMSSPYEGEYGDFLAPARSWLRQPADSSTPGRGDRHREFLDKVQKLGPVERDDALKKQAIANIRAHPGKFFKNWVANIGRLFLNYPFSRGAHKPSTPLYMVPGILLILACLGCIYPTWTWRAAIPHEFLGLALVAGVYLAGSSVLSAYGRMLFPVLPFIILWIALTASNLAAKGFSWRRLAPASRETGERS